MPTRRRESDSDRLDGHPTNEPSWAVPHESRAEKLERIYQDIRTALDLVTAVEVAELLGVDTPRQGATVDGLRSDGGLIGLPDRDGNILYPAFQIDRYRHRVHPVVAHANRALHAGIDPYGVASWWLTPTDILDGNSPLDELGFGSLTVIAVDNILDFQRAGM